MQRKTGFKRRRNGQRGRHRPHGTAPRLEYRSRAGLHRLIGLGSAMLPWLCSAAWAGPGITDEVKFGILDHDAARTQQKEHGVDINGELIFTAPGWFLDDRNPAWVNVLVNPRPMIGFSVNSVGDTSQFYFGGVWRVNLWSRVLGGQNQIFTDFGFGGAIHDGNLDARDPRREALGSRVLFHLSADVGYAFNDHYSVSGYYEHDSNGGFARFNRALNNAGVRVGYRF